MLANYAKWYSFAPPQWPTFAAPLTATLMGRSKFLQWAKRTVLQTFRWKILTYASGSMVQA